MSEDKTFNRIRRCSLEEMITHLNNIIKPPPIISMGNVCYERSEFYSELNFYFERIRCLQEYGWEIEDFYVELEKQSILHLVNEFNTSVSAGFPQLIMDRAKKIFPNFKFIPAKIELE